METLPRELPSDGTQVFTGLVCPDCSGNLVVSTQQRHVAFSCRTGHIYSIEELVVGKESALEDRLWSAVFAFDELAAFLTDVVGRGLIGTMEPNACRRRADLARRQAAALRSVIENDRALNTSPFADD